MRHLFLFVILGLFAACGGSDSGSQPVNQGGGGTGSNPVNPGNPGGGGGNAATSVFFNETAVDLGKPGAFPSDLINDYNGTLYTVDDALIPATVLGLDAANLGAPVLSVPITANDLIDHDGTTPARAPSTFGSGLFGAFTGDLESVFGRWLLVTVSAGNSISDDGANHLRLANLVVIDTQTARIVQTINLAWDLEFAGQFSNGGNYPSIPQSLPSMVAFMPDFGPGPTGTVLVAMSNGAGSTAGLSLFYNGTVQSWRADFSQPQPLMLDGAGKAAFDVTRTHVSNHFNPVGLTGHANGQGFARMILTSAGASQFDASFVAQPTTDAFLEFLDLATGEWRDAWAVNLGPILPATQKVALGADETLSTFGLLSSQTFAAAYVVDLSGLDSEPVDPAALRLLRTIELEAGGADTAGSGFQPGIALSLTDKSALLTSFTTSSLTVLGLPDDLEFGEVLINPAPFDTADLGPAQGLGLGPILVPQDPSSPVYFLVNGNFDANFVPNRNAFLGTLTVVNGLP